MTGSDFFSYLNIDSNDNQCSAIYHLEHAKGCFFQTTSGDEGLDSFKCWWPVFYGTFFLFVNICLLNAYSHSLAPHHLSPGLRGLPQLLNLQAPNPAPNQTGSPDVNNDL